MGLVDLFRPRWKHSDPAIRAVAVRELDAEETRILAEIARGDRDPSVRRLAIKKLNDPHLLREIAQSDTEIKLRRLAAERAASLWVALAVAATSLDEAKSAFAALHEEKDFADVARRSPVDEVRTLALAQVSDPRVLADFARQTSDPQARQTAMDRIDHALTLRGLAIDDQRRDIALTALERLNDAESLQDVAQKAKLKAVRTRAKRKLKDLVPAQSASAPLQQAIGGKKQKEEVARICRSARRIAASTNWDHAAAELDRLHAQWSELVGADSAHFSDEAAELKAASERFQARRREYQAQDEQQARKLELLQEDLKHRQGLCRDVEALTESTDLLTALDELGRRWTDLGPCPIDHGTDIVRRFQDVYEKARARQVAASERLRAEPKFLALVEQAEQALTTENLARAEHHLEESQSKWKQLGARLASSELTERFSRAVEAMAQRRKEEDALAERQKADNLAHLVSLCERMELLLTTDSLRAVDHALKEARNAFAKPGPLPKRQDWDTIRNRFDTAQKALFIRGQELREADEWQRWSNAPKREALCEQAELLLKEPDLGQVAQRLKALQAEWKNAGPAPKEKSEELWQRFKGTCDKVYERCTEHFAELDKEREKNLAAKQDLCAEAEALAQSADFKEAGDKIKLLQEKWKTIGPVSRKEANPIWKRFRAACDQFFERRQAHHEALDQERQANLKAKEALCEEAEALSESSNWQDTATKYKELQARWKQVGPVPRKDAEAVWQRFRGAADRFFQRRESYLDEGRSANLRQKVEICDGLLQLLDEAATGAERDVAKSFCEAWKTWSKVGPIPDDQVESTNHRLRELCLRGYASHAEAFTGTELDPKEFALRQRRLVQRAEEVASSLREKQREVVDVDASDPDDIEGVATRLRQAMASNTFRTEAAEDERVRAREAIDALWDAWQGLGPVPGEEGEQLELRFARAREEVLALVPRADEQPRRQRRTRGPSGSRQRAHGRRRRSGQQEHAVAVVADGSPSPERLPG
jgi:hypothetical protein